MSIPQINEAQVHRLVNICDANGVFSQVVPNEKADGPNYNAYMDGLRDTEQLVILGLLKEITDDCKDKLANIYAMTNRLFRIFEITDIGKAMFGAPERKWIN